MENNEKKEVNNKKKNKKVTKNTKKMDMASIFKDTKKLVYLLLAIIAILVIVIFVLVFKKDSTSSGASRENTKTENGIEISDNKKILKDRDLNGVKFTNVSLTKKDGVCTISAELINTSENKQEEFNLDIKFKDKDGNVILALGDIIPALEPNQSYNFSSTVKFDFVNSYDMEVTRIDNEFKE